MTSNNNQTELKVLEAIEKTRGLPISREARLNQKCAILSRYGDLKTQQALKSPLIANALALAKKEGELEGVRWAAMISKSVSVKLMLLAQTKTLEQEIKQIKAMPPFSGKSGNSAGLPPKMEG